MSIKAMNWALQQATGDPRAQCLLYVIADCASQEGIAWPSADWLAAKSQQSRATVYRRLTSLQDMGLCTVFPRYFDDAGKMHNEPGPGRRRSKSPEIRLHLDVTIDLSALDHDDDSTEGHSHAENDPQSQPENEGGVSLTGENGESHCSDSKRNRNLTEESPQAPQGAVVPPLEDFQKAYPIAFTDFERTKQAWGVLTESERKDAITGAAGYASLCRKYPKRNVEDAHRWLRGRKWQGYAAAGKQAEAIAERRSVDEGSAEWLAWQAYYRCCGKREFPPFMLTGGAPSRQLNVPCQWPPVGRDLDVSGRWIDVIEHTGQFAAWLRRLTELPNAPIQFGTQHRPGGVYLKTLTVPTEWPPGKGQSSAA